MRSRFSKIILFLLTIGAFLSCNSVKRVAEEDHLLTKNTIKVNGEIEKSEEANNLLTLRPNTKALSLPIRLYIYNLARPNIDSILNQKVYADSSKLARKTWLYSRKQVDKDVEKRKNFNAWLKRTGEAPVIINEEKINKSTTRLKAYYFNKGWFNVETSHNTSLLENKRAEVEYNVNLGKPYMIDSIQPKITSPVIDSLYQNTKKKSFLKTGEQYATENYINERERLTNEFRNSGVYYFTQDYITFKNDTVKTDHKVNTKLIIPDRSIRIQDYFEYKPFKIFKIKEVNIYTDYGYEKRADEIKDSVTYNNYNLYSYDKLKYKPKALTDAIFIAEGDVFKDIDRTRTLRHLSDLKTFRYPDIEYIENPDTTLTANIYLTPLKKFDLTFSGEVSVSNIQSLGLSINPGLMVRNIFGGAETFQISARGSIGASKDAGNSNDQFFDITEFGVDLRLIIPRVFSPFKTEKLIPKYMLPKTVLSVSSTSQTNIGLDKTTFNSTLNYKWKPNAQKTSSLDLFNAAYVRNLNPDNYYNVYTTSYDRLNELAIEAGYPFDDPDNPSLSIPEQTADFTNRVIYNPDTNLNLNEDLVLEVGNIEQRRIRLTENNLIFSTNYTWIKDSRESVTDRDFYRIRWKLESAGNLLSLGSRIANSNKNEFGNYELFGVAFSQYIKGEFEYIKHWQISQNNALAFRFFTGLAVPYGNSSNIPFTRSYFAGGPNDNRGWTAYDIGPGKSGGLLDFNEANFKLALNLEYRYNIFESLYGALFTDVGNIWNVFDDTEDPLLTFDNIKDLGDLSVTLGTGFRYDFDFFVIRLDIGFKTYNPAYYLDQKWFRDFNFANAVYNIGINYPF